MSRALFSRIGIVTLAGIALLAGNPAPFTASPQDGGPEEGGRSAERVVLVFEREIFTYPAYKRRNPFEPPARPGGGGGPRLSELTIAGLIHDPGSRRSLVLLAGESAGGEGGGAKIDYYRLREGEALGNFRVVEIEEMRVIFDVESFGTMERRTLDVPRPAWVASR